MEKIKDFRELIVWQRAHQLFLEVVKDIEKFPSNQVARVISVQLLRAYSSRSANIEEGFGRKQGEASPTASTYRLFKTIITLFSSTLDGLQSSH